MIEPTAMKSLKVSFTPAIEHSFLLNMLIKLTFLSQKKQLFVDLCTENSEFEENWNLKVKVVYNQIVVAKDTFLIFIYYPIFINNFSIYI